MGAHAVAPIMFMSGCTNDRTQAAGPRGTVTDHHAPLQTTTRPTPSALSACNIEHSKTPYFITYHVLYRVAVRAAPPLSGTSSQCLVPSMPATPIVQHPLHPHPRPTAQAGTTIAKRPFNLSPRNLHRQMHGDPGENCNSELTLSSPGAREALAHAPSPIACHAPGVWSP